MQDSKQKWKCFNQNFQMLPNFFIAFSAIFKPNCWPSNQFSKELWKRHSFQKSQCTSWHSWQSYFNYLGLRLGWLCSVGVSCFLICSLICRLREMTNILQILQYHSSQTVSSVCKSDLQDLLNVLCLKGNSTKFLDKVQENLSTSDKQKH